MKEEGIVEPSTSMWQSPVVMVKKKSGDLRFAVDYRKLNQVTKQISFPLPRLENIFDKLGQANASRFSTLDLASGFWQVPLDPETKEKTSFVTNDGQKYNFSAPFWSRKCTIHVPNGHGQSSPRTELENLAMLHRRYHHIQ